MTKFRQNLNIKTMTKEEFLKIAAQFYDDPSKIEYSTGRFPLDWVELDEGSVINPKMRLRIKSEPKKIPFTRETIPLRAIFRGKINEDFPWHFLMSVKKKHVVFGNVGEIAYEVLMEQWVYSLDEGKTWKECCTEG